MVVTLGHFARRTVIASPSSSPKSGIMDRPLSIQAASEASDLPIKEISPSKESARSGIVIYRIGRRELPDSGIESARNGKYKEDKAVDFAVDSKSYSRHDSAQLTAASPLRAKPTGRGKTQLGSDQTETEISRAMAMHRDTVAHHLADAAKSNYFITSDEAKSHCGALVDEYAGGVRRDQLSL